jgi:hypothetical protein
LNRSTNTLITKFVAEFNLSCLLDPLRSIIRSGLIRPLFRLSISGDFFRNELEQERDDELC